MATTVNSSVFQGSEAGLPATVSQVSEVSGSGSDYSVPLRTYVNSLSPPPYENDSLPGENSYMPRGTKNRFHANTWTLAFSLKQKKRIKGVHFSRKNDKLFPKIWRAFNTLRRNFPLMSGISDRVAFQDLVRVVLVHFPLFDPKAFAVSTTKAEVFLDTTSTLAAEIARAKIEYEQILKVLVLKSVFEAIMHIDSPNPKVQENWYQAIDPDMAMSVRMPCSELLAPEYAELQYTTYSQGKFLGQFYLSNQYFRAKLLPPGDFVTQGFTDGVSDVVNGARNLGNPERLANHLNATAERVPTLSLIQNISKSISSLGEKFMQMWNWLKEHLELWVKPLFMVLSSFASRFVTGPFQTFLRFLSIFFPGVSGLSEEIDGLQDMPFYDLPDESLDSAFTGNGAFGYPFAKRYGAKKEPILFTQSGFDIGIFKRLLVYYSACGYTFKPSNFSLRNYKRISLDTDEFFKDIMSFVISLLGDLTPTWLVSGLAEDRSIELRDWIDRMIDLFKREATHELPLDAQLLLEIADQIKIGNSFLLKAKTFGYEPLNPVITDIIRKLEALHKGLAPSLNVMKLTRPKPVVVLLWGEPGHGKSNLLLYLAKVLGAKSASASVERLYNYKCSPRNEIFVMGSDKYMDGLNSYQSVGLFDDFDQRKPSPGDEMSLGAEFVRQNNEAIYAPRMANVADKNNIYLRFAYSLYSSNNTRFVDPTMQKVEAMARRVDFLLKVTRRGVKERKLTVEEMNTKHFDWRAYDLHVCKPSETNAFEETGEIMAVDELFEAILAKRQANLEYFASIDNDPEADLEEMEEAVRERKHKKAAEALLDSHRERTVRHYLSIVAEGRDPTPFRPALEKRFGSLDFIDQAVEDAFPGGVCTQSGRGKQPFRHPEAITLEEISETVDAFCEARSTPNSSLFERCVPGESSSPSRCSTSPPETPPRSKPMGAEERYRRFNEGFNRFMSNDTARDAWDLFKRGRVGRTYEEAREAMKEAGFNLDEMSAQQAYDCAVFNPEVAKWSPFDRVSGAVFSTFSAMGDVVELVKSKVLSKNRVETVNAWAKSIKSAVSTIWDKVCSAFEVVKQWFKDHRVLILITVICAAWFGLIGMNFQFIRENFLTENPDLVDHPEKFTLARVYNDLGNQVCPICWKLECKHPWAKYNYLQEDYTERLHVGKRGPNRDKNMVSRERLRDLKMARATQMDYQTQSLRSDIKSSSGVTCSDRRLRYMTTQGAVEDIRAKVQKNMYEFYASVGDEQFIRSGSATVVHEKWVIAPLHYLTQLLAIVDERNLNLTDSIQIRLVSKGEEWTFPLNTIKHMSYDEEVQTDAWLFEVPIVQFPQHTSLVKNFPTSEEAASMLFSASRNTQARLVQREVDQLAYGLMGIVEHNLVDTYTQIMETRKNLIGYRSDNFLGLCGALLVSMGTRYAGKIFSMHIAGDRKTGTSIGSIVTSQMIEKAIGIPQEEKHETFNWPELVTQAGNDYHGDLPVEYVTRNLSPVCNVHQKNNIVPWQPTSYSYFERKTGPSNPSPLLFRENRERFLETSTQGIRYAEPLKSVIAQHFLKCAQTSSEDMRMFTLKEAICGIPDSHFGGIDNKTSTGYPDTEFGVSGDDYWKTQTDGTVVPGPLFSQLVQQIQEFISFVEMGSLPAVLFKDCEKGERLKLSKIEDRKIRLINIPPKYIVVLVKMFYGHAIEVLAKGAPFNSILKGYDEKNSSYWSQIGFYLDCFGPNVGCGDYSAFDHHQSSASVRWAMEMMSSMYTKASPLQQAVREALTKIVCEQYHGFGSVVEKYSSGMPSGWPLTSEINCVTNLRMFMTAWLNIHDGDIRSLSSFFDKIHCLFLGDDNIFAVHPDYAKKFTPKLIAETVAYEGHTYTDVNKGPALESLIPLSEATILKRGFRKRKDGFYDGPLELDVVLEMPLWTRANQDREVIALGNQDTALRELSLHGKDVFDLWLPKMRAFQGYYWHPVSEDWTYWHSVATGTRH